MKKHLPTVGLVALAVALAGFALVRVMDPGLPPIAEQPLPSNVPSPPPDPLAQHLFPPELIMQFQSEINLTDEQRQFIMAEMQEAQPKLEELQQELQQEVAALAPLLADERTELRATLEQVERIQNLEWAMKRTQLTLLITLKNSLSPGQQATLQEIKAQRGPGAPGVNPPPAIQGKMQRLQAGIQRWQESGRDPSPVGQAMQEFDPLIRAGQFNEAEAVLDEALKMLEEKPER